MNKNIENQNYEEDKGPDQEEFEKNDSREKESSDLPSHFKDKYHLKENENYEVNGYKYRTDSHGRIVECKGQLQLADGKRDLEQQKHAGNEDRKENDEGGHLIAYRFNGSGKIDNIVAMDKGLNHGRYKAMENTWKSYLNEKDENGENAGNEVEVKIKCIYPEGSERPSEIRVKWQVRDKNGEIIESNNERFKN